VVSAGAAGLHAVKINATTMSRNASFLKRNIVLSPLRLYGPWSGLVDSLVSKCLPGDF
jgi:hypothetical protein